VRRHRAGRASAEPAAAPARQGRGGTAWAAAAHGLGRLQRRPAVGGSGRWRHGGRRQGRHLASGGTLARGRAGEDMSRYARGISDYQLSDYQQAVRALLKTPFVTASFPDRKTLGRVRQFSETLALDLREAFGYQLLLRGETARLLRVKDRLHAGQPARTRTGRVFDRRRYAYLSLITALLARCGAQTTVSELAALLKGDANRIAALGFDDVDYQHRRAFVDAVGWLEERSVLHAADGSSEAWASAPEQQDALYDVDRDALFALWRSRVMLQSVSGVEELLGEHVATDSESVLKERAGQAARRAVAEQPVAYYAEHPEAVV